MLNTCRRLTVPLDDPRRLSLLAAPPRFKLTSGSFEIPETVVKVALKPELVGEMFALLAKAVELGVNTAWFRPKFEPMMVLSSMASELLVLRQVQSRHRARRRRPQRQYL
jgi:hypothetical protein